MPDHTVPDRSETSPTARALLALELIQARPGITGDELAQRLGVSDRAARRYVALLREAGMPVESVSGPYGGYRVGRGARVPPLMFSTAEALGLVMAVLRGWHGSAESDHPAATALRKIERVLPSVAAEPAGAMRRVIAQNPADAAASPDPELTAAAARACETHHRLRVRYRSRPDREFEVLVEPWAVVVRHGRWYLLCWSVPAQARRVLRVDRVVGLDDTGETFAAPADLDALREVEHHLADGWTHEVEVVIQAAWDEAKHWTPRHLGRLEPLDERTCLLRGSTDEPDWYAAQLAQLRARFTITGAPAVIAEVRALAQRLAAAVGGQV